MKTHSLGPPSSGSNHGVQASALGSSTGWRSRKAGGRAGSAAPTRRAVPAVGGPAGESGRQPCAQGPEVGSWPGLMGSASSDLLLPVVGGQLSSVSLVPQIELARCLAEGRVPPLTWQVRSLLCEDDHRPKPRVQSGGDASSASSPRGGVATGNNVTPGPVPSLYAHCIK